MKIGSLTLENPTILAPLAGITNLPFRMLAREAGCAMVCSEMISANGLLHGSEKTLRMLDSAAAERPLSVQLFGADPSVMANAARIAQSAGADVLDINFGCSVRKVVKTGAGAALMRTPENAGAVIRSVRDAVEIPLTVKIRTGWDSTGAQAMEIGRIAQESGVDAIAVHPRTATQGFSGCADWSRIRELKRHLDVPVIGNGDILRPEHALEMLETTGCDAVMIGRAAIGNPWIFSQVNALLSGGEKRPPDIDTRRLAMIRFLESHVRYFGEKTACRMMRSRLGWFTKGLPGSKGFREASKQIASKKEAADLIHGFMDRAARLTEPAQ